MSPSLHSLVGNLKKGYDNVIKECELLKCVRFEKNIGETGVSLPHFRRFLTCGVGVSQVNQDRDDSPFS